MARKTKRDWYIVSIQILSDEGCGGLTIDALTRYLEVTKGSFYHHFSSFCQFKEGLLVFIEEEGILNIITQAEQELRPDKRIGELLRMTVEKKVGSPEKVEMELRAWALRDEAVRCLIERIDRQRIEYVKALCQEMVGDGVQAQLMSELIYCLLVGSKHTMPPLSQTRLRFLFDEFLGLYPVQNTIKKKRPPRKEHAFY